MYNIEEAELQGDNPDVGSGSGFWTRLSEIAEESGLVLELSAAFSGRMLALLLGEDLAVALMRSERRWLRRFSGAREEGEKQLCVLWRSDCVEKWLRQRSCERLDATAIVVLLKF